MIKKLVNLLAKLTLGCLLIAAWLWYFGLREELQFLLFWVPLILIIAGASLYVSLGGYVPEEPYGGNDNVKRNFHDYC